MANRCLLDDALHRDFGYMNCWARNILILNLVQVCLAQPVCRHFIGIHSFMANLYVGILQKSPLHFIDKYSGGNATIYVQHAPQAIL